MAQPRGKRRPGPERASSTPVLVWLRALAARRGLPLRVHLLSGAERTRYEREVLGRFGSLPQALRAAGLTGPSRKRWRWTEAAVLAELRVLARQGIPLTEGGLRAAGRQDLLGATVRLLGGLPAAREKLGPIARASRPGRERGPDWTPQRVREGILARAQAGLPLSSSHLEPRLHAAAKRHFGSWAQALAAAGLDPDLARSRKAHTPEALQAALLALRAERPDLSRRELTLHKLGSALLSRYGSLQAGLIACGLPDWPVPRHRPGLSRAEVLAGIRARQGAAHSLLVEAVLREDGRLYRGALRHFGRWPLALAAAGLPQPRPHRPGPHRPGPGR